MSGDKDKDAPAPDAGAAAAPAPEPAAVARASAPAPSPGADNGAAAKRDRDDAADAHGGEPDSKADGKRQRTGDGRRVTEEEREAVSKVVLNPGDAAVLHSDAGLLGYLVTCQSKHERRAVVDVRKVLPKGSECSPLAVASGGCVLLQAPELSAPEEVLEAFRQVLVTTPDAQPGSRGARVCCIQATCAVTADALKASAERLTAARLKSRTPGDKDTLFTFAVLYHSRGSSEDKHLDRMSAVKEAAAGVEAACTAAGVSYKVSLTQPGVALMVDVVPVVGPGGKVLPTACLALLPDTMIALRPKVAPRPLWVEQ